MTECTARQFLEGNYRSMSVAQVRIIIRAQEYSAACRMWVLNIASKPYAEPMDQLRSADLARMAATLAFLTFSDLREEEEREVAA